MCRNICHVPGESSRDGRQKGRARTVIKKSCRFEVLLSKEELKSLHENADKAGLTLSAYVRLALAGQKIMEAPSVEVPVLIREVRRVGSNIDQILKIANAKGLVEVPELRRALEENRKVEKMISDAYGGYGSNKDMAD